MEIRQEIKRRAADIEARIRTVSATGKGVSADRARCHGIQCFCRRKASAADADGSILPDV